jgi:hypothetical protein
MAIVTPRTPHEVARFQMSSPDFPDFCITHLADPSYAFLFSKKAPGRAEYESALASLNPKNASGGIPSQLQSGHGATGAAAAGGPSLAQSFPAPSGTNCVGPHKPYPLSDKGKEEFDAIASRLGASKQQAPNHKKPTDALVEFMMRHKTKTESMVYRLIAGMNGMPTARRVEVFYCLSSLLFQHRQTCEEGRDMPYLAVFDHYLPEAVRRTLHSAKAGEQEAQYVRSVVDGWMQADLFSCSSIDAIRAVFAEKGL